MKMSPACVPTLGSNDIPGIGPLIIHQRGVEKQLQSLREIKGPGTDQLFPWLLKMAAREIAPILTDMFQTSINEVELPKHWREAYMANVCCILKKGDKSNPKHYRLISLSCITCRTYCTQSCHETPLGFCHTG